MGMKELVLETWKSSPVQFFPFWDIDQDQDQSTKVLIGQKNRTGLLRTGFLRSWTSLDQFQSQLVLTGL